MSFKNFKSFLEGYPLPRANKEWIMMIKGYLPLKDTIINDTFKVPKAFRVSGILSLKWTVKQQGQKKQLPAFLRGSNAVAFGAPSGNEILIELEGESALHLPVDAGTIMSRNGYRWIFDWMFLQDMLPKWDENIKKELKKYFKENYPNEVNLIYGGDSYSQAVIIDHINDYWTGKEKADFIKWYFDTAKKLTKKYNIYDKLKKSVESWYKNSSFKNDEVILQNYKIKGIWLIDHTKGLNSKEEYQEFYKSELKFLKIFKNIKFCGIVSLEDTAKINVKKGIYPECQEKYYKSYFNDL